MFVNGCNVETDFDTHNIEPSLQKSLFQHKLFIKRLINTFLEN